MAIAAWWEGDDIPALAPIPSFSARPLYELPELTLITRLSSAEIHQRIHEGHQPYIGYLQNIPVGYGWVASKRATIGELQLSIEIPDNNRYLWDFVTFPEWRGHSIYPHILQAILQAESRYATRFWIIYAPENTASQSGIHKAGFQDTAELSFTLQGGIGLAKLADVSLIERFQAAVDLLHVPVYHSEQLIPQWTNPTTTQTTTTPSYR